MVPYILLLFNARSAIHESDNFQFMAKPIHESICFQITHLWCNSFVYVNYCYILNVLEMSDSKGHPYKTGETLNYNLSTTFGGPPLFAQERLAVPHTIDML